MNRVGLAVLGTLIAAPALAQGVASTARAETEARQSRYQIGQMERLLEGAVEHGVTLIRDRFQKLTQAPADLLITDNAHARGFRLDGYGVFFDVEVPALRLPLAWTLRYVVDGNRLAVNAALAQLRALVLEQPAQDRQRLEVLVRQMEERNMPQVPAASNVDPAVVRDPNEAYTRAVKEALVDAMLESSGPLNLGPEEWLTVAARDNVPNDPLVPGDSTDLKSVIFKVRGSDLAAFRSGQITIDQARSRVKAEEN